VGVGCIRGRVTLSMGKIGLEEVDAGVDLEMMG